MNLSWWHLLIGFLFANGMPHFLMGVAGKTFRSPLGRNTAPRFNVIWGLINFSAGTALVLQLSPGAQWDGFLVGFWLGVAMFGFAMNYFKGEGF